MNDTTRLHVTARMLVTEQGNEAHAEDCTHEGHHLGTMTGPRDGSGYWFTGRVADCLQVAR